MLWGCFFYDRVRIEETMDAEKYRAILSENLLLSAQKAPRRTRKRQKKIQEWLREKSWSGPAAVWRLWQDLKMDVH